MPIDVNSPLFQKVKDAWNKYGQPLKDSGVLGLGGLPQLSKPIEPYLNPGQTYVEPILKKAGLPGILPAIGGFAVDVALPGPGEVKAGAKLAPKVIKTAKGMAERLATELQTYIKPGKLAHNDELLKQIGRLNHSAPEELPNVVKEVQGMVDNFSQKVLPPRKPSSPLAQGKTGEYLYHGTNETVLDSISKEGLRPGRRGELSLSKDEAYAKSFAREGMTPQGKTNSVMFRVKSDLLKGKTLSTNKARPASDQLHEVLTKEAIPPEAIEVKINGKWVNLKESTLAQEVGKDGIKVYHGTDKQFAEFDPEMGHVWFTDNKAAISSKEGVGASGKGFIMERTLPKDLKLATPEMVDKYYTDQLIQMGYDGVKFTAGKGEKTGNFYQIFDAKKFNKLWRKNK